jgi:hypothetical protein
MSFDNLIENLIENCLRCLLGKTTCIEFKFGIS